MTGVSLARNVGGQCPRRCREAVPGWWATGRMSSSLTSSVNSPFRGKFSCPASSRSRSAGGVARRIARPGRCLSRRWSPSAPTSTIRASGPASRGSRSSPRSPRRLEQHGEQIRCVGDRCVGDRCVGRLATVDPLARNGSARPLTVPHGDPVSGAQHRCGHWTPTIPAPSTVTGRSSPLLVCRRCVFAE